jgi:hypothetical protein
VKYGYDWLRIESKTDDFNFGVPSFGGKQNGRTETSKCQTLDKKFDMIPLSDIEVSDTYSSIQSIPLLQEIIAVATR